jgi:hypothetical protein
MKEESIYILLSIFGMLAHSLLKAMSLQKDYTVANKSFSIWTDYIKRDRLSLLLSLITCFAWYFLFHEAAVKVETISKFPRLTFFVMGGMGSYVCQLLFSVSKKYIRKVVDHKTNIADGKAYENE